MTQPMAGTKLTLAMHSYSEPTNQPPEVQIAQVSAPKSKHIITYQFQDEPIFAPRLACRKPAFSHHVILCEL
jgi:hypothetical protein